MSFRLFIKWIGEIGDQPLGRPGFSGFRRRIPGPRMISRISGFLLSLVVFASTETFYFCLLDITKDLTIHDKYDNI